MGLKEIKKMKADKGFTIVELLIVIVVIGILAAIVIVAYQGVTSRANTTKSQTSAVTVQKKAEAYNADTAGGNGVYPAVTTTGVTNPAQTWAAYTTANPSGLGAVPTGVTVSATALTAATANLSSTVQYLTCQTGGAAVGYQIKYWDFSTSAVSTNVLSGGTTTGTCS